MSTAGGLAYAIAKPYPSASKGSESHMRPDKLRNLLNEMDGRLARFEKSISDDDRKGNASATLEHVSGLRAEVRRHLSKPDAFRLADVVEIERRIDSLRGVAEAGSLSFGPRSPLGIMGLLNLTSGMKIGLNQLGPDEVLERIPGQKPAAFQFAFVDDRLVAIDQPIDPGSRERDLALAALATAIEHGEHVSRDLEQTNVSPRLKQAFLQLQQTMAAHRNIVQVGQLAQICNRLIHADIPELSDSHFGLLIGHVEMVFSALAQFEDWRIFVENAASSNLDPSAISKLADGARQLADEMRKTDTVDRSVADALTTATDWVEDQSPADKRDVLSLVRIVENIWSAVSKAALAVGKEVRSQATKATAAAVIAALLYTAAYFTPVLDAVPGSSWIKPVITYMSAGKIQFPPVP